MNWQRLNRDASIKVLESVKSDAHMGMFAIEKSEVKNATLPFYQGVSLYKVTNYASVPSFSFEYLGDGQFFYYMDGTEEAIHTVNDKGALELNNYNVLEYIKFYFEHVNDSDNLDITLLTNPHDMPLLDSLGPAVFSAIMEKHKLPKVEHNESNNSFTVEADLYVDAQLVRATIEINPKGRIKISNQEMIIHGVPGGMVAPEATY